MYPSIVVTTWAYNPRDRGSPAECDQLWRRGSTGQEGTVVYGQVVSWAHQVEGGIGMGTLCITLRTKAKGSVHLTVLFYSGSFQPDLRDEEDDHQGEVCGGTLPVRAWLTRTRAWGRSRENSSQALRGTQHKWRSKSKFCVEGTRKTENYVRELSLVPSEAVC